MVDLDLVLVLGVPDLAPGLPDRKYSWQLPFAVAAEACIHREE